MVAFISIFSLRQGCDPEEADNYWREKHTLWAKSIMLPELKKYTRYRVMQSWGNVDVFGMVKLLFEDLESARRAVGRLVAAPPDKFLSEYITNVRRMMVKEEEVELPGDKIIEKWKG
jgi:hypothetical protein